MLDQWQLISCTGSMARCKNVRGDPGDDDRRSPCLTEKEKAKGKIKVMTKKKRELADRDSEIAASVAAVAECAKRGGRASGVRIGDQLTPAQRATVEEAEIQHGSPRGTIMLGGQKMHQRTLVWRRQSSPRRRQSSRKSSHYDIQVGFVLR